MLHSIKTRAYGSQTGPPINRRGGRLGEILVRAQVITPLQLDWAIARQRRHFCKLGHVLRIHGLVDETTLAAALARQFGVAHIRPAEARADPALIDRLGPEFCAQHDVLPLRRAGALTLVATSEPQEFARVENQIRDALGPIAMVVMGQSTLADTLRGLRRYHLVRTAETQLDTRDTCRGFGHGKGWAIGTALIALCLFAILLAPVATFAALSVMACVIATLNALLLLAATVIAPPYRQAEDDTTLALAKLPPVSILVPLFKEREIANALIERLSRLRYPRELLDICLIVEACDRTTQAALDRTDLPLWMRVVSVPDGTIRTKPRAMNFALDFCRGEVIGIYDAEDAPPPDQILRVVHQFARAPADVGCLQGRLNYYNPRASWLTRCFAIDYAAWFNLVLPALHRLGWPIPLGGTTVFFRRAALNDAGAWDAHNVTEDADLGMRLARRGYRTDLVPTETLEEATSNARAWINQRSRWQKGYAITWLVHMRNPARLLRDLGSWRFVGVQVLFLGSLGGAALAPVLWSFWLLAFGLPHPLAHAWDGVGAALMWGTLTSFWVVNAATQIVALRRVRALSLAIVLPFMHVYHALATVALVKALYELMARPFFWHKTAHGVTLPETELKDPDPDPHHV